MADGTDMVRVEATVSLPAAEAWALLVDAMATWWPEGPAALEPGRQDPPATAAYTWAADGSAVTFRVGSVEDDLTTVIVEHRYRTRAVRAWAAGDDGWWAVLRAYVAAARAARDQSA